VFGDFSDEKVNGYRERSELTAREVLSKGSIQIR